MRLVTQSKRKHQRHSARTSFPSPPFFHFFSPSSLSLSLFSRRCIDSVASLSFLSLSLSRLATNRLSVCLSVCLETSLSLSLIFSLYIFSILFHFILFPYHPHSLLNFLFFLKFHTFLNTFGISQNFSWGWVFFTWRLVSRHHVGSRHRQGVRSVLCE